MKKPVISLDEVTVDANRNVVGQFRGLLQRVIEVPKIETSGGKNVGLAIKILKRGLLLKEKNPPRASLLLKG